MQTQPLSLMRTYTNDAANRLTGWDYAVNVGTTSFPVETDTYTYDYNGNRIAKEKVRTGQTSTPQKTDYAYDFENRLNYLQYTNIPGITGTQIDSLTYSGDGIRTQAVRDSVTADYLYDGLNILVERNGSGITTKTYTRGLDYGGGINSLIAQNNSTPASVQYYQYNDLGSTSNLTSSAGTSADSYTYDAFGNLLSAQAASDTNRYLFSTKEFDSRAVLYYFGARYYDPEIGRWLTPDPLGFVNGPNIYAYVNNNPVNLVDPYGLQVYLPGIPLTNATPIQSNNGPIFVPPPVVNPVTVFPDVFGPLTMPGTPDESGSGFPGLSGFPDEFGPIGIPAFPDGAPDLGGKENTNSINNNGDVFSSSGSGRSGAGSGLPTTGEPNSSSTGVDDNNQNVTIRIYGSDGNAEMDIDYGHNHGTGDPHVHYWNWSGNKPVRGPGESLN